jgi:GPH family glycoside/pentoside/hexuronide:cation symporter
MLHWSGYVQPTAADPTPTQPASALTALRLLISVLPALLLAASIVVAWFYPITRQRYGEIRQELARRQASEG